MKGKFFLLAFCLLAVTGAFAQQYRLAGTKAPNFQSDVLQNAFEHYTVFHVDLDPLLRLAATNPKSLDLRLDFEGLVSAQAQTTPSQLLADGYQTVVAGNDDAARAEYDRPPVYPFVSGSTTPSSETMAITVAEGLLYGSFERNGHDYFVEPVWYFDASQPHDLFVVYDARDVKQTFENFCGAVEVEHEQNVVERGGGPNTKCVPVELEIAIANDYQMVTKFGSVVGVVAHNIATMNAVQANWDDDFSVPVIIKITKQFVPATQDADPFPAGSNRDILINFFRDWANNGGFGFATSYDLGHWRSPRNIFNPSNQQIGGATYTGQLCTSYRYSIFSELSNFPACGLRTITSHEMGHSFGATHTSGIMAAAYTGCTDTWSASSQTEINAGIKGGTCLVPCPLPGGVPLPQEMQNLCSEIEECYTFDDNPCIATFEVSSSDPNLQITVTGRTICLTSLVYQNRISTVLVTPLDVCGNRPGPDQPAYLWYIHIDESSTCDTYQGHEEDRQGNGSAVDGLGVRANQDFVTIEDHSAEARGKEVRLFDQMGRQLLHQRSGDGLIQIPLSEYPAGILIVQVAIGDQVVTQKVAHF